MLDVLMVTLTVGFVRRRGRPRRVAGLDLGAAMSIADVLELIVSVALLVYLDVRAGPTGEVLTWSPSSSTSSCSRCSTPPLGHYMYRVYTSERTGAARGARLPPDRRRPGRRADVAALRRMRAVVQRDQHAAHLRRAADPGPPAPEPGRRLPGVNQYVSFNTASSFIDQHELAGLRRRDHHELPQPDARADLPELRLRRRRDGRARSR